MADSHAFEVPQPSEKLSYKFILDSVKESMLEKQAAHEHEPLEATEAQEPTQAEIPAEVLADAAAIIESPIEEGIYENELPIPVPVLPPLPHGKKYFRIGEVAEVIGVEPYVLRYWESEFSSIRPTKSGSGHRVYARKDVETLLMIKHLLHVEKFSIKGAKQQLAEMKKKSKATSSTNGGTSSAVLRDLAHELKSLIQLARTAL